MSNIAKEKQYEVAFNQVKVAGGNVIGAINEGWVILEQVLPKAALAQCAEMLGGMQKSLEMSTEHAKQRVQFDHPIGSFQAVQHHCADMFIDTEAARWLIYRTAWMMSERLPCLKELYITKAFASEAYYRVTRLGVQVHGGYGLITDYDMQLFFRRAAADEVALGNADFYREKIADQLDISS